MKNKYIFQNKKILWAWHLFTNLKISLLSGNRRKLDSQICIYIQSVTVCCLVEVYELYTDTHSWKTKHLRIPWKGLGIWLWEPVSYIFIDKISLLTLKFLLHWKIISVILARQALKPTLIIILILNYYTYIGTSILIQKWQRSN